SQQSLFLTSNCHKQDTPAGTMTVGFCLCERLRQLQYSYGSGSIVIGTVVDQVAFTRAQFPDVIVVRRDNQQLVFLVRSFEVTEYVVTLDSLPFQRGFVSEIDFLNFLQGA